MLGHFIRNRQHRLFAIAVTLALLLAGGLLLTAR